jgi:putative phosphoribosyl transferase
MRHPWIDGPLFHDRHAAGLALARELEHERGGRAIVVGLARGGVVVAAAIAEQLGLTLDAVAVRKVAHPHQPEYAIGAVGPGGGVYLRATDGLTADQVRHAVATAQSRAAELDDHLHAEWPPHDLTGKTCVLADDGLATGATMIAAIRWARSAGAARVVAAVPVAAAGSLPLIRAEADEVVCPNPVDPLLAVAAWYTSFEQVLDRDVSRLLARPAYVSASP